MKFQIRDVGSYTEVAVSGHLYMDSVMEFRDTLLEQIAQGKTNLRLDLHELHYIDSSGLGTLITVQRRALALGGQVILCGLRGSVKELFMITELDKVFTIETEG